MSKHVQLHDEPADPKQDNNQFNVEGRLAAIVK